MAPDQDADRAWLHSILPTGVHGAGGDDGRKHSSGPASRRCFLEIIRTFAREREAGVFPDLDLEAIRVQRHKKTTITYFVQAGDTGLIKIGVTTDFQKRLRSLETMSPMPLRILGVVRGDIEAECHAALAEWRKHGEWFEPTTQVFEFLRNQIAIKPSLN